MKTWKVPVYWEMCGLVEVKADTLEEAMCIAENDDSIGLPNGDYVDGSWSLSERDKDIVRELYNDNQED